MVKVKCFRNTFFGYVRNCQTSSFLNKLIRVEYKLFKTSKIFENSITVRSRKKNILEKTENEDENVIFQVSSKCPTLNIPRLLLSK